MSIGNRIRKKREELKMTQQELANLTGYTSPTSIAKIEAGKIDVPSSKISLFAKHLNTSPAYLIGADLESIIDDYKLNEYEIAELKKVLNVNAALMFSGEPLTEEEKIDLETVLRDVFIKILIKRRGENEKI